MATLYIAEFERTASSPDGRFSAQIAEAAPVAEQAVTFSTTTQSAAFNVATRFVRIHTDAICSIAFGTNPTATTAKMRMVAGATEYFSVPRGESYKVAAVTNT
jgi:hypothetical protein